MLRCAAFPGCLNHGITPPRRISPTPHAALDARCARRDARNRTNDAATYRHSSDFDMSHRAYAGRFAHADAAIGRTRQYLSGRGDGHHQWLSVRRRAIRGSPQRPLRFLLAGPCPRPSIGHVEGAAFDATEALRPCDRSGSPIAERQAAHAVRERGPQVGVPWPEQGRCLEPRCGCVRCAEPPRHGRGLFAAHRIG